MPSFDGQAEATAIVTQLETVGLVLEDVPDDYEFPADWTGAPAPYMVVDFGDPVPTARGRGVGVGEQGQPQILPFQVTIIGPSKSAIRDLKAAADSALVGWSPSATNSTAIKARGGAPMPTLAVENKPSVARRLRWYETTIGAVVDELD